VLAKFTSIISGVAVCAAGAGIALAPAALADEANGCVVVGQATVCDPSIGPAAIGVGSGRPASQNGSYGPAGDAPPVGGGGSHGLLGGLGGLL
jgi:hypothetical protein